MSNISSFLLSRLFFAGFMIRIILLVIISPEPVNIWYAPFMSNSISGLTLSPWDSWLEAGGVIEAFPYGYVMWFALLPSALLSLLGLPIAFGYYLTLLAADITLLIGLHGLLPGKSQQLMWYYWLSPVIIIATYGLGLNDVIPSAILILSICALQQRHYKTSGGLIAASISAKLSMAVALPFLLLYIYNNRRLRQFLYHFLIGLSAVAAVLILPHLATSSGRAMLLGNPEVKKIFNLFFTLGDGMIIYILPLLYSLFLYVFWQIKRTNFDLLLTSIAISFMLIILMNPASPGWFIWAVPFFAIYAARSGRVTAGIIGIFSVLYIAALLVQSPLSLSHGFRIAFSLAQIQAFGEGIQIVSVLQTALSAIGIVLMARMWRHTFQENDFFRLSRKSFVIGIAGDSGAGKDTLVENLISIFGNHSCTSLSGDDYHVWDRRARVWGSISHLNPSANELDRMSEDVVSLVNNRKAYLRHYNHTIGRFSPLKSIRPNDLILISGLHALYLEIIRSSCDLKIFLDMDEDLRRFMKIRRDTQVRGHSYKKVFDSLENRLIDARRFIHPQKQHADLIIRLGSTNPLDLEDWKYQGDVQFKVTFESTKSYNHLLLYRMFVGVLGLDVTYSIIADYTGVTMTVEGDPSVEDIEMVAQSVFKSEMDFLDTAPRWYPGIQGIIQLVSLSHISQALTHRIIP